MVSDLRVEKDAAAPFVERMERAGISEAAIASFRFHLARLAAGDRGTLSEEAIRPLDEIADAASLQSYRGPGAEALRRVAVLKLNGGLGTSMGLERAKSLLEVRDGLSFLDLIARQILALRSEVGAEVPLLLMDSFRTADDARSALGHYPGLARDDLPLSFLQHRVPKVDAETLLPASHPADAELEWCPPGHGDLYTALATSGVLELLLDAGLEYAFVSNADNLGAVLDPELLGYMVAEGLDFMLEAADRTAADRKGGHLCRLANGRLALRESAQCPPGSEAAFQDIGRYRYFNTNNVWLNLPALARALAGHGGFLPLPTLVNRKTVDPRDPSSPEVFQLETAMGSAISFFERTAAVRVPRRRFSPVKNTDDLLAARSDAYELSDDWLLRLHADREAPPAIRLDPAHYQLIDAFEERFPHGPPSLRRCRSLNVEGDITFGAGVVVDGDVVIRVSRPTTISDRSVLTGTCVF
jgi:UTP--glucose-1-phosphate uridylyltransferase